MSMDNYPQNADTVEESFVKETCPMLLQELMEALGIANYDLEDFAKAVGDGDPEGTLGMDLDEEKAEHLFKIFDVLCGAFRAKTGLELTLNFHEAQDKGDEVDGYFWDVDGVWQRTPAGEKYKDKITPKVWNVFG